MKKLSNKDKLKILERDRNIRSDIGDIEGFISSVDDSIEGILILTHSRGSKAVYTTETQSEFFPLRKENPVEIIDDNIVIYYNDGYMKVYHRGEWTGWISPRKERPLETIGDFLVIHHCNDYSKGELVCYRGSWLHEVKLRQKNPVEEIFGDIAIVYRSGDHWCKFCHSGIWTRWFNPLKEFKNEEPFEIQEDGALIIHHKYPSWRFRIRGGDEELLWSWEP